MSILFENTLVGHMPCIVYSLIIDMLTTFVMTMTAQYQRCYRRGRVTTGLARPTCASHRETRDSRPGSRQP